MIDIETLGTDGDAVVLSLGAVMFTTAMGIQSRNHWFFNIDEQLVKGRRRDQATQDWWNRQTPKAREIFHTCANVKPGETVNKLQDFVSWCEINQPKTIWGNGASFDPPIMESLLKTYGFKVPWQFYYIRCYRTVKALHDIEKNQPKQKHLAHDALYDAEYQARCLIKWMVAR